MKNSSCCEKMAVVVEIPVSARIDMLESVQCLNNKPPSGVELESPCRRTSQSSNNQRKASFNTTNRNFNKPKEPVVNTKSSRSTIFISKTKYQFVKMTGEHFEKESMLVEELYPKFRSKSSESMESEDSSSQGSGVYDKRLSLLSGLSHSDYETCGSQTSLDEYENDRLSVSSGLKEDSLLIVHKVSTDGRTSRPLSSVLGDSELDEIDCDIEDASKSQEIIPGVPKTKPERPACLDQGMDATIAWLRKELTEMRALDQSLMIQFMDIQNKIRNLKLQQQQQKQKQIATRKQKQPKQLLCDNSSELLGNHRFSWELDSLHEEDEYYDYDTEDDLDDEEDSLGACGGYS